MTIKEQLIFNKWKVGEVIEFPDVEVKYWVKGWDDVYKYRKSTFNLLDRICIKSELFKDEQHICFDLQPSSKCYYMIPKSELIRIGMLKETKEEKVFGDTFKESRNKALNQSYHPSKETKEEMKHIPYSFQNAKELHKEIELINTPFITELRGKLEEWYPELKPKLITDLVKSVEDADRYMGSDIFSIEGWKSYAKVERLAHVLNEGWVADYTNNETKHYPSYDIEIDKLVICTTYYVNYGLPVFKSRELLEHAIQHNLQLFKELFKVK